MGKLGYLVTIPFDSWKPGKRDDLTKHLEMRSGFILRADLGDSGGIVSFDFDAWEFETERQIFIDSTIRQPPTNPIPY